MLAGILSDRPDMVLSKKIDIGPFVETRPMSQIQSVFDEVHKAGSPEKEWF